MRKTITYLFFLLLLGYSLIAQENSILINTGWQFKQANTAIWHNAFVPGNVYLDLYKNQLIKDPFFSDNEKDLQWVENENWEYKTTFTCSKEYLQNKHVELYFEGLDTYATVYLNDSLILNADNMFRQWHLDVKEYLKPGANTLRIHFESVVKKGKEAAAKLNYTMPEGNRVFTRKAQFQYGWDFGPRFLGCGIWKPIKLVCWNDVKIKTLNHNIISFSDSIAKVEFIVETESDTLQQLNLEIAMLPDVKNEIKGIKNNKLISLNKGVNSDTVQFLILKPKLWWSNGLGEAYRYNFSGKIMAGKKTCDKFNLPIGIRKIELVYKSDSIGNAFYFKVNGKPVFMKGANYIPSSIFLSPKNKSDYLDEFELYKKYNFNMLRVWGGGVYPDDNFYEACDKNGILVWQDFMFACAMYPGNDSFMNNVNEETKEQIIRLRNHPSLALWCGNNEINEGWCNWGWQKQYNYSYQDSLVIWNDYQKLFHALIPINVSVYSHQTPYWYSSPSIGWGHKESLTQGDSHYWGVWWGMEPFENYQKKVGRFMSEFGFQSMPTATSFKMFCSTNEININSESVKAHQKHKTGFETINTYMSRDYKLPLNFNEYGYVSQLLQRDGMKTAIEAHRRNKPYCMGTLFWQLNDCWPAISWSAIDFYKQPKAFFYTLKKLYAPVLISISKEKEFLKISCVSDSLQKINANLNIELKNYNSKIIWQKNLDVELTNALVLDNYVLKNQLPIIDSSSVYLKAEISKDGKILATAMYCFVKPKNNIFPHSTLNIKKINKNTYQIEASVFSKDVYLYDENSLAIFDDNFFDLEAGQKKIVKVKTKTSNNLPLKIKSIVLNNL